ncbi:MAG: methylmalonyl-CoA mutase [Peptococcaceae bacterium BRH_c4b]|nr:MAG: methylmalonyl-CoA mutase [Peptococcaceae bacterium BRH_c4b]
MTGRIRVLVAKPGLDGHDHGSQVMAQALRDSGMEVIYTGLLQTPEQIVSTALQEDVNVIALSSLSGEHLHLFPPVVEGLKDQGCSDILVLGSGIVADEDIPELKKSGIEEFFGPGTTMQTVINYIREKFSN